MTVLGRPLRYLAPLLVLGIAALGFFAADTILMRVSPRGDINAVTYLVGDAVQFLLVGALTVALLRTELRTGEPWARTHLRHCSLLYFITLVCAVLWGNAGHSSGVVGWVVTLGVVGILVNAVIVLFAGAFRGRVAA